MEKGFGRREMSDSELGRADWKERTEPVPQDIPKPTFWPAVAAFAVVVLLFGFLTSWVISLVGLVGFSTALFYWIGELGGDHEQG